MRGDAFQIFCCVAFEALLLVAGIQAVTFPGVAVELLRGAAMSANRASTVIRTVVVRVASMLDCALLSVSGASLERNPRSGYRNRASNPRVGSGSASKPPNPQQEASSRLRARSRKARDD